MQFDKLSAEERKALVAKVVAWDAETATLAAESAKMKAEHEAWQRRFDAERIVKEVRDGLFAPSNDKLVAAVEAALADVPTAAPLDDAELARLKRRHLALRLVEKIAALRGTLSAATEIALSNAFEKVLAAPIKIQEGTRND
jgi:hypothetical protein